MSVNIGSPRVLPHPIITLDRTLSYFSFQEISTTRPQKCATHYQLITYGVVDT